MRNSGDTSVAGTEMTERRERRGRCQQGDDGTKQGEAAQGLERSREDLGLKWGQASRWREEDSRQEWAPGGTVRRVESPLHQRNCGL